MPAYSRQDIYARHLTSDRGYPLWTPEPSRSLPPGYLREGLKIGDVGVVVPEDGSFDVFFNLCLPATHQLHREGGGVPENFTPITLGGRDVAKFPGAENAGCVISGSSVTMAKSADMPQEDPERRAHPGPLSYQFTLASSDGAILVLPEGAEHWYLRNELPFREQAIEHAVDWYTFATQRLGRTSISNDSLYVITGFHKSRSWALAAYQQRVDRGEATAQFKAIQVGAGSVMESYSWEATQGMDRRVGPSDRFYNEIPNQTVFIQGLKIAIRESLLRKKKVDVKADIPSLRRYPKLSGGPWTPNLWNRSSSSRKGSANALKKAGTSTNLNSLADGQSDSAGEDIAIQGFPQAEKPFHPSDIINQLLLERFPLAKVAVTHDTDLIKFFASGLHTLGEPSQRSLVVNMIENHSVMRGHAVYLQPESTLAELSSKLDGMSLNDGGIENSVIPEGVLADFPHDLTSRVQRSSDVAFASGSCGDIYRGTFNLRGKSIQVAIKACKVYLQHDKHLENRKKQFRREITVWVTLEHSNVLPLLGVIRDPNLNPEIPAMVCPWVENGALTSYLEGNRQLTISKRLSLVNDVAHGLQYLHSKQIVHGDLSGSNVLVHADGSACIADFGLSTLLTRIGGSTFSLTRQGTFRWMAPELLDLQATQAMPSIQSDVYSFGSIMLQILTGNIPYYYFTEIQVTRAVITKVKPNRPDQAVVTANRWKFIERCWSPVTSRPSSDQIVVFTKELMESKVAEV